MKRRRTCPRAGGTPRKLTDEERKLAPAVNARWDRARRRALAVDNGDIVLVDSVAGTRRWIARTYGSEANPRWARNDTHVTFTRDGNLFIVPVKRASGLIQLTDVAVKKPDPRMTESQKFLKEEEQKLIEFVKEQAEQKKKDEARREREGLPKVDLRINSPRWTCRFRRTRSTSSSSSRSAAGRARSPTSRTT